MEEKCTWPCWAPGKVTGATDGFLGFVRLTEQPPPPRSLYDLVWLFRRTWGLLDILPMTPTALDQPTTRSRKTVPECTSQTEVSQSVKANYEGFSSRFPERLSTSSVTGTDDPRTRTLARVPEGRRGSGGRGEGRGRARHPSKSQPVFLLVFGFMVSDHVQLGGPRVSSVADVGGSARVRRSVWAGSPTG